MSFVAAQLEIQDVECTGSCCISEMVTSLQFVSRTVIACCHFSKKPRKAANFRRLRSVAEGAPAAAGPGSSSTSDKKSRGRTESRDASGNSSSSRRWVYSDIPCLREAEAIPDHLVEDDGCFCLSFVKVSTGQEIASIEGLPFRKAITFSRHLSALT